ncbi:MAG: PrsW family intramembrane metalloprotease [Actinomycetota bacterium]
MGAPLTPAAAPASEPHRPRWGYQTSLWQVHQPAFWLFMVVLAVSTIFSVIIQASFADLTPGGWLLSWFLLALYAVPVVAAVLVLDLYEREPMSLIVAAFLWGAFAATSMSIFANQGWGLALIDWFGFDFAGRWAAALTAPFTEEITKGVGVILIYLIARSEIDDLMDGFVYGAMVGLGFTIVEDVFYFVNVFGGDPGGVLQGFFVRVIASGLYGHVLYTGLFGMGVAYFVSRRREATAGKRLGVAVLLTAAGIFAHFLWNSPLLDFYPTSELDTAGEYLQVIFATAVKGLPFLAILALMLVLARRREHRWLRAALATEIGREGLHPDELAVLESPSARRRSRREMGERAGPQAAHVLKRLQKAQINLAMVATRVHQDDHPDLVRQRQYCQALRDWLLAYGRPRPPAKRPGA